jgi:hypothetical protein
MDPVTNKNMNGMQHKTNLEQAENSGQRKTREPGSIQPQGKPASETWKRR